MRSPCLEAFRTAVVISSMHKDLNLFAGGEKNNDYRLHLLLGGRPRPLVTYVRVEQG